MRDIERIDRIINKLSEIRHQNPDLRFTQLLTTVGINKPVIVGDTTEQQAYIQDNFHMEDDVIEERLYDFVISNSRSVEILEKEHSIVIKLIANKHSHSVPTVYVKIGWVAWADNYDIVLDEATPSIEIPTPTDSLSFYTVH